MVQVTLNYAFMLAVMCVLLFYALIRLFTMLVLSRTFQLGFIFSLIVGLGVGEMMFGRFGGVNLVD